MRKFLGVLVGSFLIVAALVVAVAYSSETAIYECSGFLTKSNTSSPFTLFIRVTQDRWWVFWDPVDGRLRWEYADGTIPIVPGDDVNAPRFFQTRSGSRATAPPFGGLLHSPNGREDFFVIKRADTFLNLYRWPKAGETVDLTKSNQGGFSTISNSLTFYITDEASFKGSCKPKNN